MANNFPRNIRLLIFDLDGTLIDSKLDLALSVNRMRAAMGRPPLEHALIYSYVGDGAPLLVRRALDGSPREEIVSQGLAFFLADYREHMLDHTVPYPGVREALEALRERTLGVLTNKPVNFSREILQGLGLAHYFLAVYGGNSFEQKKPDPVGIFKLMEEAGTSPLETMMVGDSDTDVLTGQHAHVWTCGVRYGFGSHTLALAPPDFLLENLRELPTLLNGLPSTDKL